MLPAVRTDQEWQAVIWDEQVIRPAAEDLAARLGLAGTGLRRYPGGSTTGLAWRPPPAPVWLGLPAARRAGETAPMEKFSLDAIAREQAKRAAAASSGRSAETVYGGHEHALRQTVLALTAGSSLDEHENPGEATVQVLSGRVRLTAGEVTWDGRAGDLLVVPDARHALHADEDAVILLTVSKAAQARHT